MIQLLGDRQGYVFVPGVRKTVESVHKLFANLASIIAVIPENQRHNLFFTLAHHKGARDADVPQRKTLTFEYQEIFALDIDEADVNRAYDYRAVVAETLGIPKEAFGMVNSGGGIHLYLWLKTPIQDVKYFKENKKYFSALCFRLTQAINAADLKGFLDPAIFDAARIMRIPGSVNHNTKKYDAPKPCVLLELPQDNYEISIKELSGVGKLEEENISPETVKRLYPTPDLEEITKECKFIEGVINEPEKIKEPQAFDFFSIMYAQSKDTRINHQGTQRSAVELSKWVFDNAVSSSSLRHTDFGPKWEGAGRYGPRKCATINDAHGVCGSCRHFGLIESPIQLKSKDHISSSGTGYWVMNQKGQILRPNYSDLVKVFIKDHNILVNEAGRFFLNSGSNKYSMHEPIWVKALMEKTMSPSDPVMERHRVEFISKLKGVRCLSKEKEDYFFMENLRGKLNYRNGVLDVFTGEFKPYDVSMGFRYSLPHNYSPKQDSPYFMDWLKDILCDEKQYIDTALDVMAYTLWPEYDDHMFVMMTGDGRNGKSTFLNVIKAILGDENCSSVSLKQLVENRFAPAALDGKMANLSGESSGVILGHGELNILKELSAGGQIDVEHKGKQGYKMKNTAKLFFSVNRAPNFKENSEALRRRMIVIPFGKTIENMDPNIEKRLIEEAPGITNMLVQRMKNIVQSNNNTFKITRGNGLLQAAQQRMLSTYNSIANWAEETLIQTKDLSEHITVDDAYVYYKNWCDKAGEFVQPRKRFTRDMNDYYIADKNLQYKNARHGEEITKVFAGVKFGKPMQEIQ